MADRKLLPLLLFASLFAHGSFAQEPELAHFSASASLSLPSPELRKAVDNGMGGVGVGFAANVLFNPSVRTQNSPFFVGADFGYHTFGRDKTAGTDVTPPYKTSFNFYSASGVIRFFPLSHREGFALFVDGLLGAKILNARTKIDKNFVNTLNNDQDEVINNETDTGLGYGIGLGAYRRKYVTNDDGTVLSKASFSVRVAYHWGTRASYVKRGSLVVDNGTVTFETAETSLDMLVVQFGFYVF